MKITKIISWAAILKTRVLSILEFLKGNEYPIFFYWSVSLKLSSSWKRFELHHLLEAKYFCSINNICCFNPPDLDSEHAEVLVYDWSEKGETEVVVEDVERIDFDQYGVYDAKMKDWRRLNKWDWNSSRYQYVEQTASNFTSNPTSACIRWENLLYLRKALILFSIKKCFRFIYSNQVESGWVSRVDRETTVQRY